VTALHFLCCERQHSIDENVVQISKAICDYFWSYRLKANPTEFLALMTQVSVAAVHGSAAIKAGMTFGRAQ